MPVHPVKNIATIEPVKVLLVGNGIDPELLNSETYRVEILSVAGSQAETLNARNQKIEIALISAQEGLSAKLVANLNLLVSGNFRRLPFIILLGPPPEAVLRSVAHSLGANEWFRMDEFKRHFPRFLASVVKSRDDEALHDLLVERFDLAIKGRKWNDARQALDGLLMLDERNAFLVSILSYAIEKRVDPASAREFLERTIVNIPSNATIRAAVASIYLNLGLSEHGHQLLMELARRSPLFLPNLLSRHLFTSSDSGLTTLRKLYSDVFGVQNLEGLLTKWHAASKDIDRMSDVESILSEMVGKLETAEVRQIAGRILGNTSEEETNIAPDNELTVEPNALDANEPTDAMPAATEAELELDEQVANFTQSEVPHSETLLDSGEVTLGAADGNVVEELALESELSLAEEPIEEQNEDKTVTVPEVAPIVVELPKSEQKTPALEKSQPASNLSGEKFKPETLDRTASKSTEPSKNGKDFVVPERVSVQLPKPKQIDFSRFMAAVKTGIDNQKRIDVLIKTAPDRSLEGSYIVYHFDIVGAAKLGKHLEDLGCKDVDVVSEKNELIARHRVKKISGMVVWIEPNRTDSIETLMDLLAHPEICPSVITAVFGSNDAIKKTIQTYPSLIFDFPTTEVSSRSKFGRAVEQSFKNASVGGANRLMHEIDDSLRQSSTDLQHAKSLIAELGKIPGKKIWSSYQLARLQLVSGNAESAMKLATDIHKIAPQFWPAAELFADCLCKSQGAAAAANYLMKAITSAKHTTQDRAFRAGEKLAEWQDANALGFLLMWWQNNRRLTQDAQFNFLAGRYVELTTEAGDAAALAYYYAAGHSAPGRWDIMRSIASKLGKDRYHYRAEEVWEAAQTLAFADKLECGLGLVRCYYEGRKMRKGDSLLQQIMKDNPNNQSALEILKFYRRQIA